MKMTKWLTVLVMAGVLALAGCSKAPSAQQDVEVNGVKVSLPALQQSLSTSTDKDVQSSQGQMAYGLRYRNYAQVQAELAKLAANPTLTDAQKKLVAKVDEQMKQVVAKASTAPTQ
jgi:phage tail protein X